MRCLRDARQCALGADDRSRSPRRSLRGAPSALLLHPDEASPAHPSAPPGPSATTDVAPASRAQAGAAPAQPQLPLCVNWTTRETFQGPYMFSGVEKMVKSMRAAQEKRFEAERKSPSRLLPQPETPD